MNTGIIYSHLIVAQDMAIQNRPARARMELTGAIKELRPRYKESAEVRKIFISISMIKNTIREFWHVRKNRDAIIEALECAIGLVGIMLHKEHVEGLKHA